MIDGDMSEVYNHARYLSDYGMKWRYDCKSFYYDCFCGYNACMCRQYGSLDVNQHERHPDVSAMTCPDYEQKNGPR